MSDKIITRVPPSPTGPLHLGTARTALFNYLFAKKNGGKCVLRFEDTDKARSKKEFEVSIYEGLEWLGIPFDGIYRQSERTLIFKKHLEKMLADGTAYLSDETGVDQADNIGEDEEDIESGEVEPEKRSEVIRIKNPGKVITFTDLVRGEISIDTKELGDFVIAKSLEEPLYHLAVVVDDYEMGVTHVIRGEDGIYNTPRQILILEAIGAPRPVYCHIPFVLGTDRKKLSKRNGSVSVQHYKEIGYLPEAMINYLALLGWNPGGSQEIFSIEELATQFELEKIQKAGAIFDIKKLNWFNQEHIRKMPDPAFKKKILEFLPPSIHELPQWDEIRFDRLLPELRERIEVFSDIKTLAEEGELDYFFNTPEYETEALIPKAKPKAKGKTKTKGDASEPTKESTLKHLKTILGRIDLIPEEHFVMQAVKDAVWEYASAEGRGDVLWPMRFSLSGREKSPDPFILSAILGKNESMKRINGAIERLSQENGA